jgi:hypothetical protein
VYIQELLASIQYGNNEIDLIDKIFTNPVVDTHLRYRCVEYSFIPSCSNEPSNTTRKEHLILDLDTRQAFFCVEDS